MQAEEVRRLIQGEKENAKPKKLLNETKLEKMTHRDLAAEYIRWGRRMAYSLLARGRNQRPTPWKRKRARIAAGGSHTS